MSGPGMPRHSPTEALTDIRYARFEYHKTWPQWARAMRARRFGPFSGHVMTPARRMVVKHMCRVHEAAKVTNRETKA